MTTPNPDDWGPCDWEAMLLAVKYVEAERLIGPLAAVMSRTEEGRKMWARAARMATPRETP